VPPDEVKYITIQYIEYIRIALFKCLIFIVVDLDVFFYVYCRY